MPIKRATVEFGIRVTLDFDDIEIPEPPAPLNRLERATRLLNVVDALWLALQANKD